MRAYALLLSSLLVGTGSVAQAQDVGQHPAIFAPRQLAGVDPSTFIVGHPASPSWRAGRANYDHPAVVVKRQWVTRAVGPEGLAVSNDILRY
jgi:hypothetical protein